MTRPACLLLLLIATLAPAWAQEGRIGVSWDPVPGASGYRIYFGASSGVYDGTLEIPAPETFGLLEGLGDCVPYYLAVKAFNTFGESADFSNEIAGLPAPRLEGLDCGADPIAPLPDVSSSRTCLLTGANYAEGFAVVGALPDGITVEGLTWVSCQEVGFDLVLAPAPEVALGTYRLEIENPDAGFGFNAELLVVESGKPGIVLSIQRSDPRE